MAFSLSRVLARDRQEHAIVRDRDLAARVTQVPTMETGDIAPMTVATLSAALSASEARFRGIIEMNADGIFVIGRDGTILFANPAATSLLERKRDELIGREFGIPMIPGETTEIDVPIRGSDVRVAEMRIAETEWEGRPALIASLRDVSDRKKLEEQLRRKTHELEQAHRRKEEFLAMLAHELRNPLAPILNAVHIMRLCSEDPTMLASMRDSVEQQVRVMARLVDDLLDLSRITRGTIALRLEPSLLPSIISRAVEITRPHLMAKQHELRISLPNQTLNLWADPVRIEQVLINLLDNATKYTDMGGRIEIEGFADDTHVVIRVRDNGIGIAPEMLPEIFDLFTQADRSLDRSQGGLGIGLTLARNLVHLHQGSIEARSDGLGRGSEFLVTLPRTHLTPLEDPPPEINGGSQPMATSSASSERPWRVLVVDDNIASAKSLAMIVELWGHECQLAHTGPDGVEAAESFRPDLILLDIGLPGMDGYSVAQELRKRPQHHSLILVAMTGYGRDEDRIRSMNAGFDHHFVKPLDLHSLESFLTKLAEQATSMTHG